MKKKVNPEKIYRPSDDVVAREIEGELILVPISSGIGDMEDELYTLNDIGKAVWKKLDGKKNLKSIAKELKDEYESEEGRIEEDVIGFVGELLNRGMLVEKN